MNDPDSSDEEFFDAHESSWLSNLSLKGSVRPVTIAQLLKAERPDPEGRLTIDGQDFDEVTVVAQLRRMDSNGEEFPHEVLSYELDDGTGVLNGTKALKRQKNFLGEEANDGSHYVRATGSLRLWKSRQSLRLHRSLEVTRIRLITSPLEVQYHLLQAMEATLFFNHGPPPPDVREAARKHATTIEQPQYEEPPSMLIDDDGDGTGTGTGNNFDEGATGARRDPYSHLNTLERGILLRLYEAGPLYPNGVSLEDLEQAAQRADHSVASRNISEAVEKLIQDNYISSTRNNTRYKLCSTMYDDYRLWKL